MPAVVMIMVDALRRDYIGPDTTPFMNSLAADGCIRTLVPPFGFEPDHTIFAGLEPVDFSGGTQFKLAPSTSPFWFIPNWLGRVLDRIPSPASLGLRLLVRWLAGTLNRNRRIGAHATPARIPFQLLHLFDFTQQSYPFESGFAPSGSSLFDVAKHFDIPFLFHGFPRDDVHSSKVLASLKRQLRATHGLVYLHIGDLDSTGHRFGPRSSELKRSLTRIDGVVREIVSHVRTIIGDSQFIIFGDHGMCSVERKIDVAPVLMQLELTLERDYFYFLDSTLVRFWCVHEAARESISEVFDRVDGIQRVDPRPGPLSGGSDDSNTLGDLVYQVEEGWIIHPSFYAETTPPKGMHGYGPEVTGNRAAGIIWPQDRLDSPALAVQWDADAVPMRAIYDVAREGLSLMRA